MSTIKIGGTEHAVTLPDFASREEIALAYYQHQKSTTALRRVAAAAVGLCTPAAKGAGATYDGADMLAYGGKVYSHLRERGATLPEVMDAGLECVRLCSESIFPRDAEVQSRTGFTDPVAEG
jgi:hypothetical protein